MENIAFIFARKNSKRLPKKNIKNFAGKPLISVVNSTSINHKKINRVVVSTDCEQIAKIALEYGAEVPFLRPPVLASDESPEWLSWQHALKMILKDTNALPKMMISLPVTSPLRNKVDIENCIDVYEKKNADIVISVTESNRNPYFNMVQVNDNGLVEGLIKQKQNIHRTQDAPKIFDITTVAYVANPDYVLSEKSMFNGKMYYNEVPRERSIDIDTLFDFEIAEYLMKKKIGLSDD